MIRQLNGSARMAATLACPPATMFTAVVTVRFAPPAVGMHRTVTLLTTARFWVCGMWGGGGGHSK